MEKNNKEEGFIARQKSFLTSLAGLITAIAALIAAYGALTKTPPPTDLEPSKKVYKELAEDIKKLNEGVQRNHEDMIALRSWIDGYTKDNSRFTSSLAPPDGKKWVAVPENWNHIDGTPIGSAKTPSIAPPKSPPPPKMNPPENVVPTSDIF